MTPEEKFNREIWYVLRRIKEKAFYVLSESPIEYKIKYDQFKGSELIPSPENEEQIIRKLEELKAIKIIKEEFYPHDEYIGTFFSNLQLLQPKFDEIYKKYQEIKNKESDPDILSIQLKNGLLTLNKSTGFVNLNNFETSINPSSQEFKVLLRLMSIKNYQATYKDLLGENVSKTTKRELSFVIRNIKEILRVLPAKKAKNKDCIQNIKMYGYKLII